MSGHRYAGFRSVCFGSSDGSGDSGRSRCGSSAVADAASVQFHVSRRALGDAASGRGDSVHVSVASVGCDAASGCVPGDSDGGSVQSVVVSVRDGDLSVAVSDRFHVASVRSCAQFRYGSSARSRAGVRCGTALATDSGRLGRRTGYWVKGAHRPCWRVRVRGHRDSRSRRWRGRYWHHLSRRRRCFRHYWQSRS